MIYINKIDRIVFYFNSNSVISYSYPVILLISFKFFKMDDLLKGLC